MVEHLLSFLGGELLPECWLPNQLVLNPVPLRHVLLNLSWLGEFYRLLAKARGDPRLPE